MNKNYGSTEKDYDDFVNDNDDNDNCGDSPRKGNDEIFLSLQMN